MHWVLSDTHREAGIEELRRVLDRLEIRWSEHKVVPFEGRMMPGFEPKNKNVMVIGPTALRRPAKAQGWFPGYVDVPQWDEWEWNRKDLLNGDAMPMMFWEALKYVQQEFPTCSFFIRPLHDSKVFAGEVTDHEKFAEWHHKVVELKEEDGSTLTGETPVLVAPIKTIHREYRFFVVDGRIVASSLYKEGDRVRYDPLVDYDVEWFASSMIAHYVPARMFTLDVAVTPAGLRIIEAQNLNSSGLYAANVGRLVEAIESANWSPLRPTRT